MRYTSFTITNFKGIQNLKLDLDGNPDSKVSILVGLNESGKTTIMEALSFFYENIRDINEEHLTLHPSGITDKHSLIPKNRKDNFSDQTEISAFIELDEQEIKYHFKRELFIGMLKFKEKRVKEELYKNYVQSIKLGLLLMSL